MKKKILIVITVIILIIGALAAINLTKTPVSSKFTISSYTSEPQKFIAHRGFSSVFPENTIPAIKAAVDEGFYGVEFDIHTTKDGIWILNHDSDIDKMTDGSGEIADMTFQELQEFNIDNGKGIENYNGLKLPRFEEALGIIKESDIVPFIEIKGYDPVAFRNLLDIIEEYGLIEKAVIISFDMEALLGIRELDKEISLMYLTNKLTKEDVDICKNNGNIGVDINFGNILKMKDAFDYAKESGLETGAWTVDFPIVSDLLNLFGIKYITTNRITQ
ncbi:MAG: hypothetical protein E7535_09845 [Ruminococcaceae bacterium]|nr:hypothetical protein [Oscillospiraceae bacterium]